MEPKQKPQPKISVHFPPDEFVRWTRLFDQAKKRNDLVTQTKVARELLGLAELKYVTSKEAAEFRGRPEEANRIAIYLGDEEQKIIRKMAAQAKVAFEDQARELILEALLSRNMITDRVDTNVVFLGDRVPKMVRMPLLGEIAAGQPIEAVARNEKVDVPETFVKPGRDQFVLRAKGDSMIEEGIHDGALIVCDAVTTAKNGDMVVALIDGENTTVKKMYREKNRVRLQPANKLQKPIYVDADRLQIQGVVVGIIRHRP
jgi:SOS regulatory protein LexA